MDQTVHALLFAARLLAPTAFSHETQDEGIAADFNLDALGSAKELQVASSLLLGLKLDGVPLLDSFHHREQARGQVFDTEGVCVFFQSYFI